MLLVAAPLVPFLAALALLFRPRLGRALPILLPLAPLPALAAALLLWGGVPPLVAAPPPFRLTLELDLTGAMLTGAAAVMWMLAGAYAATYLRADADRRGFAIWWLLTASGSFAVFLVADLASFYLAYALVSLAAYGLATHDDTAGARRAGRIYLALTLLGEALLIAAFVLIASSTGEGNPLVRDAVAALPGSPWRGTILVLVLVGFGLKMGLFPLHVWMPLAHSVAPVPGSAALSAVVVKAGVIGLLRFLPAETALPAWGAALAAFGVVTAFYGVAVGLTQSHPKRVLAYSTVSQMGVVAAVIGAGLAAGDAAMPRLAAFYAVNHMLLKGAMFLAVGVAAAAAPRRVGPVVAVAAILGLGLAGLPATGGALAKYAVKPVLGDGVLAFLVTLSAVATTLLMARFVRVLPRVADGGGDAPAGLWLPLGLLAAAALALPYGLYGAATGGSLGAAFAPSALLDALWPVALGLALAWLLLRRPPNLREIPAGDIVVVAERLGPAFTATAGPMGRADGVLRRWPVATVLLLGLAIVMAGALAAVAP